MEERAAKTSPPDRADLKADAGPGEDRAPGPAEAPSRQSAVTSALLRARWADPAYRTRITASMAAKWQDTAYRERASGNNRDERVYGWRHVASGTEVRRTKQEMREEYGLKPDGLDAIVAGRIASTLGWALIPKPRMPAGPRWIFP